MLKNRRGILVVMVFVGLMIASVVVLVNKHSELVVRDNKIVADHVAYVAGLEKKVTDDVRRMDQLHLKLEFLYDQLLMEDQTKWRVEYYDKLYRDNVRLAQCCTRACPPLAPLPSIEPVEDILSHRLECDRLLNRGRLLESTPRMLPSGRLLF